MDQKAHHFQIFWDLNWNWISYKVPLHQCVAFMSLRYNYLDIVLTSAFFCLFPWCPFPPLLPQTTFHNPPPSHSHKLPPVTIQLTTRRGWPGLWKAGLKADMETHQVLCEYIVKDKELRSIAIIGCSGKLANWNCWNLVIGTFTVKPAY